MVNLNGQAVVRVGAGIEMGMGLAVSLCDKYVAGVNDDAGGGYCPKDFVHPIEGLRYRVGRAQFAGEVHI
jgi:hypothetical protein